MKVIRTFLFLRKATDSDECCLFRRFWKISAVFRFWRPVLNTWPHRFDRFFGKGHAASTKFGREYAARGFGAVIPKAPKSSSRMVRQRDRADSVPETEEGKRRRLPAGDAVPREAPALTVDERRAAAGRAMARARETLDSLQRQGVRMPLTNQRLEVTAQWGEGLLQRAVDGRPTDEASRAIQQGKALLSIKNNPKTANDPGAPQGAPSRF